MNVRELVLELRKLGYEVKARERSKKEGSGLRITKINGTSFTGSKGNAYARSLLGVELSSVQKRHLASIKTPKKQFGAKKQNLEQVDDATKKKIRNLQQKFRKRGLKEGIPTLRNYRYVLRNYGKAEADRLLEGASRYVKGQAYLKNIQALIERMDNDLTIVDNSSIRRSREIINDYYLRGAPNFLDTELMDIYELLYAWEQAPKDNAKAKAVLNYVEGLNAKWKLE